MSGFALSRRRALGFTGLVAAGAAFGLPAIRPAMAQMAAPQQGAGFYRFKIGEFDAWSVSDGTLVAEPVWPTMALNAPEAEFKAVVEAKFQSAQRGLLHVNQLIVDTGRNKVLIDTGTGATMGPGLGHLTANLANTGIAPADIDTVILTHAHADHVGGTVGADGALVFPNAQYFMMETEWAFWTDPAVSLAGTNLPPEFQAMLINVVRTSLPAVEGRIELIGSDHEIVPGITSLHTPGHTPGHLSLLIASGDTTLLHTTDVVHHYVTALAHPEWTPAFDQDPAMAVETRKRVLDQAAADRMFVHAYHFPFPGLGHIRPVETAYEWEPIVWEW